MSLTPLPDRGVLAVVGEDAHEFLQGLITNDIRKVTPGNAIFAALLSPQGKFLFDFFISEHEDKLLLETDATRMPDLQKRLSMYRLRAKVGLKAMPELHVAAMLGEGEPKNADDIVYADPRLPELGKRFIYNPSSRDLISGSQGHNYALHRLYLGIPEGAKDLTIDRSLVSEYGYDELHALDFAKGCYVGQEIVARTKHRATLRKFIHCVKSDDELPPFGTVIMAGEREAGTMASSAGQLGLAHLRVEEVVRAKSENMPFIGAGVTLTAQLPGWCKTSFGEDTK